MVYESIKKNQAVYQCEICGFGYRDLRTAEACEEFCDMHGFSSPEVLRKAVYRPIIQVVLPAA
jgi:C4-type Zn-finger protein